MNNTGTHGGNIRVITAGAGSGKTSRISFEICRYVGEQRVSPERVIATTFTRKAAAELQGRIRAGLVDGGYLSEARAMGSAEIGTVHSVCGSLLRRYCYEAGIAPEIGILSEQESKALLARSIGDAVSSETQQLISKLSAGFGYNDQQWTGKPAHDWHDDVRKIIDLARSNKISAGQIRNDAALSISELRGFLPAPNKEYSDLIDEIKQELSRALSRFPPQDNTNATRTARQLIDQLFQQVDRGQGLSWKDLNKLSYLTPGAKSKQAVEALTSLAGEHLYTREYGKAIADYITAVSSVVADTLEQHTRRKEEMGVMDFVDQEAFLLEALDLEDVRRRVREEFSLLVVDEFQDTSPVQLAIFTKLAEIGLETVWVGDQKQSIYAFRDADPQLMQAVVEALPQGGVGDHLETSYRSRPELVDFANSLFTPAFKSFMPGVPVALTAHRPRNPSRDPSGNLSDTSFDNSSGVPAFKTGVRFISYPYEKEFNKKEYLHTALAAVVREILDSELPVGNSPGQGTRPVRLSDVAILCRTRTNTRSIAGALTEAGIPCVLERPGLAATPEGVLILAVLRYLADPRDSLAVAEILMLTENNRKVESIVEERVRLVREKKTEKWGAGNAVIATLNTLRPSVSVLSLQETFEKAVVKSDLIRTLAEFGETGSVYGNIERFRELIDEYTQTAARLSHNIDTAGFVRYIDKLAENEADLQALPADEDAAQVLTYHGSKGLEWPVVILADLDNKLKVPPFSIEMRERGDDFSPFNPLQGRSIRFWPDPTGGGKGFLQEKIEESHFFSQRGKEVFAEECRLLYVGITRARDYLYIPAKQKAKGEIDLPWFQRLFGAEHNRVFELPEDEGIHGGAFNWEGRDVPFEVLRKNLSDQAPKRTPADWVDVPLRARGECDFPAYRMSASDWDTEPESVSSDKQHHKQQAVPPRAVSSPPEQQFESYSQIEAETSAGSQTRIHKYAPPLDIGPLKGSAPLGEAVHAVLLLTVGRGSEPEISEVQNILRFYRITGEFENPGRSKPEDFIDISAIALGIVRQSTAFLAWLRQTLPDARLETEVSGYLKKNNRLITARVDLLGETKDGFFIIDHKTLTNLPDPEAAALRYLSQLNTYSQIVEAASPGRLIKKMVHFPLQGQVVEVGCG